jgi:hypothetical protein
MLAYYARIRAQNIERAKKAGVPVGDRPEPIGTHGREVRLGLAASLRKKRRRKKKFKSKSSGRDALAPWRRAPGSFENGKRR